jgi:type III secretory pathway component EscV
MAVQEGSKPSLLEFGCGILALLFLGAIVVVMVRFPKEVVDFLINACVQLCAP